MRTFSTLVLALVLAFATAGCTANKVGVVNPARLFQDSASGKAGFEHLKQLEAAMQQQLVTAQGVLEKAPGDEALRTSYQQVFVGYQQLVNTEQQKVVEGLNAQIQEALESYRKQKGLAVILNSESALVYAPTADVTQEILSRLDAAPLSFSPVTLEPLPPYEPKAVAPRSKRK